MQPEKLIELFNVHKVKYLLIGATACAAHGHTRATTDIDIFIEAKVGNCEKTLAALSAFGYDIADVTLEDVLNFKLLFRQYWLDTDIHPFVKGASFESAWKNRLDSVYQGVPSHFASLDDLIKMKKAAGRPKDLEDLKNLYVIRRLNKEALRQKQNSKCKKLRKVKKGKTKKAKKPLQP